MSVLKREEFIQRLRRHFNEPILIGMQVARLVGFAEDDHDYYLICDHPNGRRSGRVWHSAVGGYVFLDGLAGQNLVISSQGEQWDDLWRLDNMLALNGAPRAPEFLMMAA